VYSIENEYNQRYRDQNGTHHTGPAGGSFAHGTPSFLPGGRNQDETGEERSHRSLNQQTKQTDTHILLV
jgi:hypothetical protein